MNELVVCTINEVIKTSREICRDYLQNRTISKYRKQALRDALDAYIIMRKGQNQAEIFDNNMKILERSYHTVETMPVNTLLYETSVRQFSVLANSLEQLLRGYTRSGI